MDITIDFGTREIFVPKNYTGYTQVQASPEVLALDTEQLFLDIRSLEASVNGAGQPRVCDHNLKFIVSGIEYAQALIILAPYFITFEDGQYSVRLDNSISNIVDFATPNQVRLISLNSAGLSQPQTQEEIALRVFEMWVRYGLQPGNPTTFTPTRIVDQNEDVDIALTGDGENSTTATRQ